MSHISQDNRLLSIESPLGKDELLLVSCSGSEYISDIFEYQLDLLSSNLDIKPQDIVGKQVTIKINTPEVRYINGHINSFTLGDISSELDSLRTYNATLIPWLWFLSKRKDCRIFQKKSAVDIIKSVISDSGYSDYKIQTSGTYLVRDYCVQYNETDYDFIHRLLQEEGISYYFRHTSSTHTLIFTDANTGYDICKESNVKYSRGALMESHINDWSRTYQFSSGKVTTTDYDFETPTKNLEASSPSLVNLAKIKDYEVYTYPGEYINASEGKRLSKNHMEMLEQAYDTVQGSSSCGSFTAGCSFNLNQHESSSEEGKYLLHELHLDATDTNFSSGSSGDSNYSNSFLCVPENIKVRPLHILNKNRMTGPQTAIVVGPKGEEIYLDKFNRIKVQFHWDRLGKNDENSSCWIRVSESFSGKKWGTHFIPRIGQEVIVDFINGDPDKPIISGAVYNGDNTPPYTSKTQSGIKTHSTLGGGASNYNEFRFDDKKGEEEVYFQAEKDSRRLVKNDEEADIQANQSLKIKDNRTITVTDGNEDVAISKGKHTLTVKQSSTTKAQKIVLEADQSIELKVGGSSIKMTAAGIVIKSTKVDVKGSAMVVIKGGLTKIN